MPDKLTDRKLNLRLLLAALLWCALVGISLAWNLHQIQGNREEVAFESARSSFEQILIARLWNAGHGGVYVPVTAETQPNPYLEVPERDLRISDDLNLTLVNPAYMTRQLSALAAQRSGIQFHITSLKPLRPENAATEWETAALREFEQGAAAKGEFVTEHGRQVFRYMSPLVTESACLRCHEGQGYRQGDIRGGISVTLPNVPEIPLFPLLASHLGIAAAGALVILIMGQMLGASYGQLRQLAEIDALTGIPNRRYFNERLLQEVRRRHPSPLSLILCDIDHFKAYNDRFGHQAGDRCLQSVARTLNDSLQRAGDFCARFGGEEFVLVLPNTPLHGGLLMAEKIRQSVLDLGLENPDSTTQIVSMSCGVTTDENSGANPDRLIDQADQALYRAKHLGRNRVESFRAAPASHAAA